jgi:ribonuclease BN (tRNA processing enzyme)
MAFNTLLAPPHALDIYGPPGTKLLVNAAIEYFSVSDQLFAAESNSPLTIKDVAQVHDVSAAGTVFQDEKIKVIAAENSHFTTMHLGPQSYGTDRSFSYRIESKDRTVVFTGDTGPSEGLVKLARGADVLVSEVVDIEAVTKMLQARPGLSEATLNLLISHMVNEHLSPAEVGKIAQRAGVKMVVLTHFVPGVDSESDPTVYTAGVKGEYSGPVFAGRDLDEY